MQIHGLDAASMSRSHSSRLPRKFRLQAACQRNRAATSQRLLLLVCGMFDIGTGRH
jgi:hypothetical protein